MPEPPTRPPDEPGLEALRKQAEAEAFQLTALVESSDDAIIGKDLTGNITSWNKGAERIFGYTAGEMIGTSILRLIPADRQDEENQILERIAHGESVEHFETLRQTKDGRLIDISVTASPIKDTAGKVHGVSKVARDITDRKRTEAALRAMEEKFRRLVEQAIVGIYVIQDDRFAYVNPKMAEILGYSAEALTSAPLFDFILEEDRRLVAENIRKRLEGVTESTHYELRMLRKDGSVICLEVRGGRAEYNGRPAILGTFLDLTERKQAEDALRLFRNLVDQSNDTFEVVDPATGRFLDVNQKGCIEVGYSRGEFLSLRVFDLDPFVEESTWPKSVETMRAADCLSREGYRRRKDGSTFQIELSARLVRLDRDYIVAVVRDITGRKQAERILLESERRFREMLENVELIAMTLDKRGAITFCNDFLLRTTGWTREEVLGADWCEKFLPGDLETRNLFFQTIEAGTIPPHHGNPIKAKDGRARDIVWNNTMLRDTAGNVTGVASIGEDVTERKLAEEARLESEKRLRQVVENIREVFWMIDLGSHRLIYISPGYETIWGRTCESLYASPDDWADAIHPEDRDRVLQAAESKQVAGTYDEEYRITRPDDQERWIRDRAFPVKDEAGSVYRIAGVAEDVTERKKLEQQFLRAQRMESIGTLAGGIAHDLNNVLSPIIMSLDLFKMRFPDPDSQDLLAVVATSAQHGADMVRQVLSFARGVEGRRMEVQIKHLIRDIEKIASETLPKNIQVSTSVPHNLWTTVGDPTQLHQVLLNLCVNARDAMPAGGKLTISAENRTIDEQYAGLSLEAKPGPYVYIEVEDTGTGIPSEIIEKIFNPFYTTKEVGKGTGLGLSTSMAIVKSHHGFIQVYSEEGKGTKFHIYVPALTEVFGAAKPEIVEMPRGNGELILVIDDAASVRQITQQTLQAFGYRVVLASDGVEAVATYAVRGTEIAAVVTDMMMPVMDGAATIRVLRHIDPNVRIIAASGLSAIGQATEAARLGVKHFLPKPYTAEVLLKVLKEILSEA